MFHGSIRISPKKEIEHEIQMFLKSPLPNIELYKQSSLEAYEVKKQFLEKGVIQTSTLPCKSPIIIIPNKDGTWWKCIDYTSLKKITLKNWYLLPRIDDLLD